jgi:hypothetical protein
MGPLITGPLFTRHKVHKSIWSCGAMTLTGENRRTRRKIWPSATSSTTSPTWTDLVERPRFRGENPATNRLSYGTAKTILLHMWSLLRVTGSPRTPRANKYKRDNVCGGCAVSVTGSVGVEVPILTCRTGGEGHSPAPSRPLPTPAHRCQFFTRCIFMLLLILI